MILTQALKRSPINLRPLLRVPPTQNPKALALFLSGFLKLSENVVEDRGALIDQMIGRLAALRSPDTSYYNWGYSFPWQGRSFFVPRGAPNLVCTHFVSTSLLDAYEQTGNVQCLDMAVSAAEYILRELYWTDGPAAGFAYPSPDLPGKIYSHSANFLASAFLCRVGRLTRDKKFRAPALQTARYGAQMQRPDGSWPYGDEPAGRWIDSFHTGYNLCALRAISLDAATIEFDPCVRRGFEFYRARFFRNDGAVRYFHNRTYPVDAHSVAQAILTLIALRDLDPGNGGLAQTVFQWALRRMWDRSGFFYYQVHRAYTIRTSYMRWTQAWMFLALATLLREGVAV